MYRLLSVDDEEIEREGMADYIPWAKFEIELTGTARNGIEALEMMEKVKTDIVLTDVKMPEMDGIELIRRAGKLYPDVVFVVLSGYGEYEFTSQAMEEGVRHYLLKPCDEEQIMAVLDKVKAEIGRRQEREKREKEYRKKVDQLLPRAKEQIFRSMLLGNMPEAEELEDLFGENYREIEKIKLLAFASKDGFDYLECFVLDNVLSELLGEEHVLLYTYVQDKMEFLLDDVDTADVESAVERIRKEFSRLSSRPVYAALSTLGSIRGVEALHGELRELLKIGEAEDQDGLICLEKFQQMAEGAALLVDYGKIRGTGDFGELIFEIYLAFLKMDLREFSLQQKEEICSWTMKVLYGETLGPVYEENDPGEPEDHEKEWQLLECLVLAVASRKKILSGTGREDAHMRKILLSMFRYIGNTDLSIQFLAKEVMYMNEDYFGRIFQKNRKVKFSAYLTEQRVRLAERLWQFDPELKVSAVAEMVGYSADGQYFSKVFRRIMEMTPTEYREYLKEQKDREGLK